MFLCLPKFTLSRSTEMRTNSGVETKIDGGAISPQCTSVERNEAFQVVFSHVDESAASINTHEGLIQSLPMPGGMVVSRIVTRSLRERA
ncbi:hypothetical protein VNO77_02645 [Canavalia gladiata]|uniref:Uncharacterized protein n=1 Tax=Canavalia gladiata TaxID=3824 RepID=A0AAN9MYL2_CANGL